jgi:flagellar motor switch protein FliG
MARQNANGEKNMDGVEKAAILLIALGPEKSAQIFKHLKEVSQPFQLHPYFFRR